MTPDPRRSPPTEHDDPPGAWLSALVDGRAEGLDEACSRWRDDTALRRDWHAYHLIGDVMRSEDLASPPGHDAAFLAGLRQRLAAEPVVLAPAPPQRRRPAWLVPAAAAAGFAVVAGALVVARMGQDAPGTGALVAQDSPPPLQVGTRVETPTGMVRDAALDQYLRAHRQIGPSLAISTPGYPLRNADYVTTPSPDR